MAGYATRVDVDPARDGGVQVVDDGRGIPVAMHPTGDPDRRGRHDRAARRRQVRQRLLRGLRRSARRRHLGGQRAVHRGSRSRSTATATSGSRPTTHSVPGPLRKGEQTKKTGTTVRFWADPDIFETTTYDFETIAPPPAGDGLPQQGPDHHLTDERVDAQRSSTRRSATRRGAEVRGREAPRPLRRRRSSTARSTTPAAWRTSSRTSTGPRTRSTTASSASPARAPATRSRSRCSGTPATPSRCTPSPTRSTPMRAAPTKRASAPR